jgi:hypothetical protein
MSTTPESAISLCCLLWARPGLTAALEVYETSVLALVPAHGGTVVHRAIGHGTTGQPDEVQTFVFPDRAALDDYLADPRRTALASERDRVVARTELFPVTLT